MELSLETFLGSWHHVLQYLPEGVPLPVTSYIPLTHFTVSLLYASTTIRSVAHTSLLRHSFISIAGTGISACFPSTTPFGLALGPDLPRADEPSPGILGLSVCRILTYISLLTPAFSLPCSPPLLTVWLLRACNAPLPLALLQIRSFGSMLSPGTFSAQGHSTSELLRTLSRMAASEPTS